MGNSSLVKSQQLGIPYGTANGKLRKMILFKLLIWDLNNIAFSHLSCNIKSGRKDTIARLVYKKVGPEGTAWCRTCKEFLPTCKFVKNPDKWDGYNKLCKSCWNIYRRKLKHKLV